MGECQVLRDEIGTAVRQIKSRADQFSLIMHGQEGEGEEKAKSVDSYTKVAPSGSKIHASSKFYFICLKTSLTNIEIM